MEPRSIITRTGRFGLVTIAIHANGDNSQCESQAEVVAQDRWLVMDPGTSVGDSASAIRELGRSAAMEADRTPGEVLLRRGCQPLRLWAIIHDLNRLPTCQRKWIAEALLNILRQLGERQIESVSMPCLGCAQGTLDAEHFLRLLARAINKAPVVHRLRINLTCDPIDHDMLCTALQQLKF